MLRQHSHRADLILESFFLRLNRYEKHFGMVGFYVEFLSIQHHILFQYRYLQRHQLMQGYQIWYDRLRFTQQNFSSFPSSNLKDALQRFQHQQPLVTWGSFSELMQDSFLFLRLIGYLPYLNRRYKVFDLKEDSLRNEWEMFVRMTHQHPRSMAAAFLFSFWFFGLMSVRKKPTLTQRKNKFRTIILKSLDALAPHPYWGAQVPYFAQLKWSIKMSKINVENNYLSSLANGFYGVDVLVSIAWALLTSSSQRAMVNQIKKNLPQQDMVLLGSLLLDGFLH